MAHFIEIIKFWVEHGQPAPGRARLRAVARSKAEQGRHWRRKKVIYCLSYL